MNLASAAQYVEGRRAPAKDAVRHYAFGLEIESTLRFEAVLAPPGNSADCLTLETVASANLERAWTRRGSVSLIERRHTDGRLIFSVRHHSERGYRVAARGHGCHVITSDGRRVQSALPAVPAWRWQRLLFAQVLPLTATLRGFELFHASAVAIGPRAYGFVAASGTGKTSVAAHLVASGASFVTDDVLALEARRDRVFVHPGAGLLAVHASELAIMAPTGRARLGRAVGWADKTYLAHQPVGTALPLAALYYLQRNTSVDGLSIIECPPDPRVLLSSAFIWYLRTPDRLWNHLDVCARVAQAVPLFAVRVPSNGSAAQVAERIAEHAAAIA